MNLVDLLKLPAADAVLPVALPTVGQALPTLPAFGATWARSQSAVPPPAGLPATLPLDDGTAASPELPALPPEGLAWLASPALAPVAAEPDDVELADKVAPLVAAAPLTMPLPVAPSADVAERAALPQDAETVSAMPVAAWMPLPAQPAATGAAPAAPARANANANANAALPAAPRPDALPTPPASRQMAAVTSLDESGAASAPVSTDFAGWLAAQTGEAEPAPAAPLQTALRLPEPQAAAEPGKAWRQPLLVALGDRLQLQIAARSEQAVIRLEPPLLGRIDIAIRHEGGELQVRMVASHAEVGRQLQQLTEPLRQDLLQRHSGEVSVQVSAPAEGPRGGSDAQAGGRGASTQQQQQQQQQQHQERRPGRGLAEEGEAGGFATPR